MSEPLQNRINPYAEDDDDTAETSLAGRFFLWRWYKRTTRGFGNSRTFFMPLGFLALGMLAFHLGFPALAELTDHLLWLVHKGIAAVAGLGGQETADQAGLILSLPARRNAAGVFALLWAILAAAVVSLGALPPERKKDSLGYVVPGSGILARMWGVIGKRIYQLRKALAFLLAYIRDLNLQKIHLPLALLLLLALAYGSLALALENLFWEVPFRVSAASASTGWISPAARIGAAVILLVLGIPMLANSLLRAHDKSVRLRTEKRIGFVRRRLTGWFSLFFVTLPLCWMALRLFGGQLV